VRLIFDLVDQKRYVTSAPSELVAALKGAQRARSA
jgi:hypothetical protein